MSKKLHIVMGMPNAGKSHFIKNNDKFKDLFTLDLWNFQENIDYNNYYDSVMESYAELKEKVIEAFNFTDEVVMEHTLLKKIRRDWYYEDFYKEIPNLEIELYLIQPSQERFIENSKIRHQSEFVDKTLYSQYLNVLEIPDATENVSLFHLLEIE